MEPTGGSAAHPRQVAPRQQAELERWARWYDWRTGRETQLQRVAAFLGVLIPFTALYQTIAVAEWLRASPTLWSGILMGLSLLLDLAALPMLWLLLRHSGCPGLTRVRFSMTAALLVTAAILPTEAGYRLAAGLPLFRFDDLILYSPFIGLPGLWRLWRQPDRDPSGPADP